MRLAFPGAGFYFSATREGWVIVNRDEWDLCFLQMALVGCFPSSIELWALISNGTKLASSKQQHFRGVYGGFEPDLAQSGYF